MRYRIEYTDRRHCSFANGTNELISKLQASSRDEIADVVNSSTEGRLTL